MEEKIVSKAIIESYMKSLISCLDIDVAIAGAGPSGLICGYYLAEKGFNVAIFERSLRIGGGMPGGGMMFNRIVIEEEAVGILKEIGIKVKKYKENLYVADAIETICGLAYKTVRKGVKIFNLISVEDLVIREKKVEGVVLNWTAVGIANLHVDPLAVKSKIVVDATGHDCELCRIVEKKVGAQLRTETGKVIGERSMWAEAGEKQIVENTKEIFPGLVICGMAANAVAGSPRMGAIFGGMFLSGRKAAEIIERIIK